MFDADLQPHKSRINRLQIAALCGLMVLGALFVYSATMVSGWASSAAWYNQSWFKQIIWYLVGLAVAFVLCLVDYHTLARWSFVGYWIMIFLLVCVLVPGIGVWRFGARRKTGARRMRGAGAAAGKVLWTVRDLRIRI